LFGGKIGLPMKKFAKGKRPVYLGEGASDRLLSVLLALMGEVSVLHDRLDAMERLLAQHDLLDRGEVEGFEPDEGAAREREAWRSQYVERVLRALEVEGEVSPPA
jgi:hypothetical protein